MRLRRIAAVGFFALAVSVTGCGQSTSQADDPDPATPASSSPVSTDQPAETMDEWLSRVEVCLEDRGWDVEIDLEQNGIIADSVTSDQTSAFGRDEESCSEQAGKAPNDVPMTPELAGKIFDHLVEMRVCLSTFGYETSEPPARTKFIDDYMSGRPPWSPFLDIPDDIPDSDWKALLRKCPQAPEELS